MAGRDDLETCETVRPQIAPYAAGKLTMGDAANVAMHLAGCDACAREAAFNRVLTASLPRLPVAVPPPALFEQIARATYAAPPRHTLREAILNFLSPAPTRLALGTAFAISIAALVVLPRLAERDTPAPVAAKSPAKTIRDNRIAAVPVLRSQLARNPSSAIKKITRSGRASVVAKAEVPGAAELVTAPRSIPRNVTAKPNLAAAPVVAAAHTERIIVKLPAGTAAMIAKRTVPRLRRQNNAPATVVAENPTPKTIGEVPAAASQLPKKVEPDMDHAVKVATAMPDPTTPIVGSGAAGEASGGASAPGRGFTLRGSLTGRGSGGVILPPRSSNDQGNASGLVSVVRAPATVD